MKTTIQQLMNDVNIMAQGLNEDELLDYFNRRSKELLEAEKEQIMESFNAGHLDGYESGKYNEEEIYAGCDDYFNKTFKSEQ